MARSIRRTSHFDVRPTELLDALISEELLVARHRLQGAVEVMVREAERSPDRLVQEVEAREPAHTLAGRDRSRLDASWTTYVWDLGRGTCRWAYEGPHGERLDLSGVLEVCGSAGGAQLVSIVTVEARVPLLGAVIEKRVLAEIEAKLPGLEELIAEHL